MKKAKEPLLREYPFATELITDIHGQVSKVILDFRGYQELLESLEDAGLYQAMQKPRTEKPVSREEALAFLEEK